MKLTDIGLDAYRLKVEAAAALGLPCNISDAQAAAAESILAAVASGQLSQSELNAEFARLLAQRVHERAVGGGKNVIKRLRSGQGSFSDITNDTMVSLGEGQITTFGNCNAMRLSLVDRELYQNVEEVNEAYAEFRHEVIDVAMPVLIQHAVTVAQARMQRLLP